MNYKDKRALKTIIVIPTLNGGDKFNRLLKSISKQSYQPHRKIMIDSTSTDNTLSVGAKYDFEVVSISRDAFNHGLTRQQGVEMVPEADVVVFLTQDAILTDELAIENLVDCFQDTTVGIAYGRQLPLQGAKPLGAYARLFNYPPESRVKSLMDAGELGIKTAFVSNSFAAYRCSALKEVGGFPSNTILSEDMYVAAKMLIGGWKVAYCAEAQVYHSHDYSLLQEFKRYFDIGVFQGREKWIRECFGQAEGQGFHYVESELKYLWNHHYRGLIPEALVRTAIKYLGYKLGLAERCFSSDFKRYLSMNSHYWKQG